MSCPRTTLETIKSGLGSDEQSHPFSDSCLSPVTFLCLKDSQDCPCGGAIGREGMDSLTWGHKVSGTKLEKDSNHSFLLAAGRT